MGWEVGALRDFCRALKFARDLIEYAHGDEKTKWGALRIADGQHPAPYKPFMIEIVKAPPVFEKAQMRHR